jgi:hypothetical protein
MCAGSCLSLFRHAYTGIWMWLQLDLLKGFGFCVRPKAIVDGINAKNGITPGLHILPRKIRRYLSQNILILKDDFFLIVIESRV